MIVNEELTAAFNQKPKLDINKIKKMTPGQLDAVKVYGSSAENLLTNKDFALFVHHFKFDLAEELSGINGHSATINVNGSSNSYTVFQQGTSADNVLNASTTGSGNTIVINQNKR